MRTRILVLTALVALVGAGCSGNSTDDSKGSVQTRLSAAKDAIDQAASIDISVTTDRVPDGVSGLKSATGVGTHDPAFKGKVSVVSGGAGISADVVAVNGSVWAKLGFSPTFLRITPADLKAPDPALLVGAPGRGLATILEKTPDAKVVGKSRDGSTVLSKIKGTLSGDVVREFLPTADIDGSFAVTYRLTDDDELADAAMTGPFYKGAPNVTYVVKLKPSAKTVTISPPKR